MEGKQNVESGLTLVELFNMLFRNLFLIIAITVGVAIVGIVYTFKFVEPTYVSSSDVMVQVDKTVGEGSSTTDYDLTSTLRIVQTVAEFVEKDIVIQKTINDLGLKMSPGQIRSNISVNFSNTSLFINIKYESTDPELSKDIVNSIISNAISLANVDYPVLNNTIFQVGQAKKGSYASPNKVLNTIISLLLGGVIGVVAALLLEAFKTTVRNKKDLELLVPKYQVIGVIAQIPNKEKK